MKSIQDQFSQQAAIYKKYRPHYPQELYEAILTQVGSRQSCWDCGTGNGQVATVLAGYFKQVYATDISEKQLQNAEPRENIHYQVERAESTQFPADHFDLITVGQALHWFDFEAFREEVQRVARPGAILAVWGYRLLIIEEKIDAVIDHFYEHTTGPYWQPERRFVDAAYQNIPLAGTAIASPDHLGIEAAWSLNQLEGYFRSWSSVQSYRRQNEDDPVAALIDQLRPLWGEAPKRSLYFPLFLRLQRIEK